MAFIMLSFKVNYNLWVKYIEGFENLTRVNEKLDPHGVRCDNYQQVQLVNDPFGLPIGSYCKDRRTVSWFGYTFQTMTSSVRKREYPIGHRIFF